MKEVVKSQIMNGRMIINKGDIANEGYFDSINKSIREITFSKDIL
ncbi:hypothetical protein Q5M85_00510 [Paraclostridium bifermentans]|nr:hypothetical protein [Paraclostridium bifermentans]